MRKAAKELLSEPEVHEPEPRRLRADSQRKMSALLEAAMEVFATSGVDAPVRDIADKARVGLGTVYRHFPKRSDLIVAVFRTQVESCADAAATLSKKYGPEEALARWMQRYVDLVAKKRGLAAALHSGDPAYNALPGCFNNRLLPAFDTLLKAAVAEGVVRPDVGAEDLLRAVATLCQGPHNEEPLYARKMVALLVDGLRYGARTRTESDAVRLKI